MLWVHKITTWIFLGITEKKRWEISGEERENIEGAGLEASLPSAPAFLDGDDYFNVMMDSFDLFLKTIL